MQHCKTNTNVLLISEPGQGGVFGHLEDLARCILETDGYSLSLAYSKRRTSLRLEALVEQIDQSGGITVDLGVGNAPELLDVRALLRIMQTIKQCDIDIIHAHSCKAGVLGRIAGRLCRVKRVFYTPHGYYGMTDRKGCLATLYSGVEKALASWGETIHVSNDEKVFAEEKLRINRPSHVVLNGVDFEKYKPATPTVKGEARARFDLPSNATVIGSVGRLTFQKNPQLLFQAFDALAEEDEDVWLLHVGSGDLEKEIEDLIQGGLRHANRIRRVDHLEEPLAAYQALDVFAMSSRYEGLPLTVLEAIACNLPLVLTQTPGLRVFQHYNLNQVFTTSAEQPAFLRDAFLEAIQAIRSRTNCNHRDTGYEHFSIDICLKKTMELYQRNHQSSENRSPSLAHSSRLDLPQKTPG